MNGGTCARQRRRTFCWMFRSWMIARKQDGKRRLWCVSFRVVCGAGWRDAENQIRASRRPPGEPGRWCIRSLSFSEMAEPQSPRQQKHPCARKHSFFLPLSWTANRRQRSESKKKNRRKPRTERWEERWELSHPLQNSSHILCFQWEDWAITVVCQMFCLDPVIVSQFSQSCLIVGEQGDTIANTITFTAGNSRESIVRSSAGFITEDCTLLNDARLCSWGWAEGCTSVVQTVKGKHLPVGLRL